MKLEKIFDKNVWIVEAHNEVLLPWSKYRRDVDFSPLLLTLDHHTDIHAPFAQKIIMPNAKFNLELQKEFLNDINYNHDESIERAVRNLKNDEHIKTALQTDIVKSAYIISKDAGPREEPVSEEEEEKERFYQKHLPEICVGIKKMPKYTRPYHYKKTKEKIYMPLYDLSDGSECTDEELYDRAIDDSLLEDKFRIFSQMNNMEVNENGFNEKYILDIDLDYFHTKQALTPVKHNVFYSLIKNAEMITIAKEEWFVNYCSNGTLTANYVLESILSHVREALSK